MIVFARRAAAVVRCCRDCQPSTSMRNQAPGHPRVQIPEVEGAIREYEGAPLLRRRVFGSVPEEYFCLIAEAEAETAIFAQALSASVLERRCSAIEDIENGDDVRLTTALGSALM